MSIMATGSSSNSYVVKVPSYDNHRSAFVVDRWFMLLMSLYKWRQQRESSSLAETYVAENQVQTSPFRPVTSRRVKPLYLQVLFAIHNSLLFLLENGANSFLSGTTGRQSFHFTKTGSVTPTGRCVSRLSE